MAHDRTQLGLDGNARRVRDVGHGTGRRDVALQIEAGGVHHHGAVAAAMARRMIGM